MTSHLLNTLFTSKGTSKSLCFPINFKSQLTHLNHGVFARNWLEILPFVPIILCLVGEFLLETFDRLADVSEDRIIVLSRFALGKIEIGKSWTRKKKAKFENILKRNLRHCYVFENNCSLCFWNLKKKTSKWSFSK